MTSLYSKESFESGTMCTVMSALGIFVQCLGRAIPRHEDKNGYYLYLNAVYIKMETEKAINYCFN